MENAEPIIVTENLSKRYNHQNAVDSLSFSVQKGEIFGFLGPNGSGKTTTILMLLGLTRASAGTARVCGLDPVRQPIQVKRMVGYLPENVGFYGDLDAFQSLEYIAKLNSLQEESLTEKIHDLLNLVGLGAEADKKVAAFSRGMKQRLGIAEVLIKDPRLMILDEPTLGLDPEGASRMIELIQSLNQDRQLSVLVSSHNLYQVQRISHRVGILIHGKMVAEGTLEDLANETFGLGEREYSLEEVYMKYFQEG